MKVFHFIRVYWYAVGHSLKKRIFRYWPIIKRNKIFITSYSGEGYGDNPKYIVEELLRRHLSCKIIWAVRDKNKVMPLGVKKTKWDSMAFFYHYFTSKVIINNKKADMPVKRKKQYYIQTWHGGFPFKYIEQECADTLSTKYVKNSIVDSAMTDLMIASESIISNIMRSSFWYDGEVAQWGNPRNDIYFNVTQQRLSAIRNNLGIPEGKHILVYAPTYREGTSLDGYQIDIVRVLDTLKEVSKDDWVAIIRLHPNVYYQHNIFHYDNRVIDGTVFPDPQEVFLISDLCITDYSSLMADFFIMNKPVFIFASDYDEYIKIRPLRDVYQHLPAPFCKTNDELLMAIRHFDQVDYIHKLEAFKKNYFISYDDGHASERVVDRIVEVMGLHVAS